MKVDITFKVENSVFNYRVCAIIIDDKRILAMHDERSPYFYLPGGRVKIGETAEDAIIREVREELGIDAKIDRPLWINQSFFTEDVDRADWHELCLYFLIDTSATDLAMRGDKFVCTEHSHALLFEWLPFERLEREYFYPIFLKKEIYNLPKTLVLRTENE